MNKLPFAGVLSTVISPRWASTMAYFYATAFAAVGKSLSAEQRQQLTQLRGHNDPPSPGAFLYSQRIERPDAGNTDFLFAPAK